MNSDLSFEDASSQVLDAGTDKGGDTSLPASGVENQLESADQW